MAKDKRLFARLDLDYADHPKISRLSDTAFRAHIEMILYARKYKTDGIIPQRFAKRVASEALSELLANDDESPSLIDLGDGTFLLHGYADMNETRDEIERRSLANVENGRRGGVAKAQIAKRIASKSLSESVSEKGGENVAETETEIEIDKRTPAPAVLEGIFNQAWAHWPKKTARKAALDKFKLRLKGKPVESAHALAATIAKFGDAYAATTEPKYTPALGVWIAGERWSDDLPGAVAPAPKPDPTKPRLGGSGGLTPEEYHRLQDERAEAILRGAHA